MERFHILANLVIFVIGYAVLSIGSLAWRLWRIRFAPRPWGGHRRRSRKEPPMKHAEENSAARLGAMAEQWEALAVLAREQQEVAAINGWTCLAHTWSALANSDTAHAERIRAEQRTCRS